jgi:hypothetical protein
MAQPFYHPTVNSTNNPVILVKRDFYGEVQTIDCTYMVASLMADAPATSDVIDWVNILNGVKQVQFDAIVTDINSHYGKVSFLTSYSDSLFATFKHYLSLPSGQRHFTLPVWSNRDDTTIVRANLKRVLSIIQSGLVPGVGNAEQELLMLLRSGTDVRVIVKGVFRPYKMVEGDSQNARMGIYFEVQDLTW